MNTKIDYMYRDASNYKVYTSEVLEGELTPSQIASLKKATDADGFIPSQVGLRNLQSELIAFDSDKGDPFGSEGDDHVWHEINKIAKTEDEPTLEMTASEFYKKVMVAKKDGWNIEEAIQNVMGE